MENIIPIGFWKYSDSVELCCIISINIRPFTMYGDTNKITILKANESV